MFQVEIYGRVRRAVRVEGRSQRAVAREFGLSRETVRKMLQYAVPPGYQRQQPIKRPKRVRRPRLDEIERRHCGSFVCPAGSCEEGRFFAC